MGLESSRPPIGANNPEEHLDHLLDEFPKENIERIEVRIAGKPLEEQIAIVEDSLKKRRETLNRPKYVSSRLRMIERVPDSVFDRFDQKEKQIEVGRGENGRVFEYQSTEDEKNSVVFKMLVRPPMEYQNDLLEEGAYQADVAAFAEEHPELRIGVPHPYYVAASSKGYVLAMEKLPGNSIKQIATEDIVVPPGLDINETERQLARFVDAMNSAGFYHRDLREGNVMIDLERTDVNAPVAYIIDFGFCTKAGSEEEAYRTVDGARDYGMIRTVVQTLRERQGRQKGSAI